MKNINDRLLKLLNDLGYNNVTFTDRPVFKIDDKAIMLETFPNFKLNEFLENNKTAKTIYLYSKNGEITNRCYVDK